MDDPIPGKTDDEVLAAIESHHAPAVGVTDIADVLPVTRQAVYSRLQNLEADGLVESYKVSRDTVWYLTPAGRRYLEKGADQSDQ
jgi:DNA-binding MarR family transcriptional regulator